MQNLERRNRASYSPVRPLMYTTSAYSGSPAWASSTSKIAWRAPPLVTDPFGGTPPAKKKITSRDRPSSPPLASTREKSSAAEPSATNPCSATGGVTTSRSGRRHA
eukprot:356034-Chlamydomonas_euryale.AAC.4